MSELPLLFAFTAGLLATVNPCGFAMLPAYLSFLLGLDTGEARPSTTAAVAVAVRVGGLVAAGFVAVFGSAGVLAAVGVQWLVPAMPWLAIAVGAGVVGLGALLLMGGTVPVPSFGVGQRAGTGSAFGFGVSYALASLSCTLPVFLTVVAAAAAQPSLSGRLATVAAYAGGMALLLLAVTVALGVGKASLVRRLRALTPRLQRAAGGLLVLAGVWVIAYWLAVLATGAPADQAVLVDRGAAVITDAVAARPLFTAGVAAAVVVAGAALAWHERRRSRRSAHPSPGAGGRSRSTPARWLK